MFVNHIKKINKSDVIYAFFENIFRAGYILFRILFTLRNLIIKKQF